MNPQLLRLLPILALIHIAGLASKAPMPAPAQPRRRGTSSSGGSTTPRQQGARGVGQGHHGAGAAARGGVQSLRNLNGLLPNQQPQYRSHHAGFNAYAALAGLGNQ